MQLKSMLLVCIMLLFSATTALATGPTLTVGSASYKAGQTVSVPITLTTNGASISDLAFEVQYDPTLLSAPQVVVGAAASAVGKAVYDNKDTTGNPVTPGKYRILIVGGLVPNTTTTTAAGGTMTGGSSVLGDGVVATVTFTAASTATGTINLTDSFTDASDASANSVAINGTGVITPLPVSTGLAGDCNGDGKISLSDVQYAINIVIKKAGFTYNSLCDVNMPNTLGIVVPDGKTTLADVQTLINVIIKKTGWVLPK
jgi:hypothetical protein